jgi:flagellar protein FlbD
LERKSVIQLTRLNNQPLTVNSDLIKFVEQSPDTVITLVTGEKIVVRESAQQILDRLIAFRREVLRNLPLAWDASWFHLPPPLLPVVSKDATKREQEK